MRICDVMTTLLIDCYIIITCSARIIYSIGIFEPALIVIASVGQHNKL